MLRIITFLTVLQCFFLRANAQTRDTVPVQKTSPTYDPKEEIVVNGKRFRVYNNWVDVGSGEGINSALPWTQYVLDVDMHFHFGKQYIQLGTFLSGDRFLSFNNYNIHLCYGKRWASISRNVFVCAGPSYSWGFPLVHGIYDVNVYHLTGLFAEATYIFKQAYDLGIGVTAFGDVNSKQSVYGLRLELYFSGAYRGQGRKKAGWMK